VLQNKLTHEVMGVNSSNYLSFPKIIVLLLYPFVIGISMFRDLGGWMAGGGFIQCRIYQWIPNGFHSFSTCLCFLKTLIFAMLLATIILFMVTMKGNSRSR
jgi:phospholipid/cholesterol/gamma-HCH transport system permease protein